MRPIAVWISIVLHIVILVFSYLDFYDFFGKHPIKDTGRTVFDFVTIGDKSKAPVLSSENSRATRKKSYTENKENNKKQINTEQSELTQLKDEGCTSKKNIDTHHSVNKKKTNKSLNKKDKIADMSNSKINNQKAKDVKKKRSDKSSSKVSNNKKSLTKPNKKSVKSGTKALVDKTLQNKKTSNIKQGEKGILDSIIDNALADGNYENYGVNAEAVGDTLTATQIDLVRETIRPCWHFPAGLKDADTLVVDIKMELNQDGYVTSAKISDTSRLQKDTNFKTAAESALRAVLDPACNPLPLPKEKYNEWKDLELSFNPTSWM